MLARVLKLKDEYEKEWIHSLPWRNRTMVLKSSPGRFQVGAIFLVKKYGIAHKLV
jgi:hypothetical protein